jgi:hypothetical protein
MIIKDLTPACASIGYLLATEGMMMKSRSNVSCPEFSLGCRND